MLSFFRRIINSKAGVIVTFVVLGVIALAFAAGDVSGLRNSGLGSAGSGNVAKVGGDGVSVTDLNARVATGLDAARQQQPTLSMQQFVDQGAYDGILNQLISSIALEKFGLAQGMVVSKRAIDGQIASIPGLQGPTGKFDPAIYQRLLAQRKLTDGQVRADFARDAIGQQLILPTVGASQVASSFALPFASLLLEKRDGQVGFVPATAMGAGAAPTDAELATYYQRNIARFTVPERRVIRYATVSAASVKDKATPTEAEIAQAYQQQRARFAPSERRDVTQVVVADQAGANAIAAKIKGGAAASDAARAAGLEAAVRKSVDKAAYAAASSASVADAVFAAPRGATIGPIRGPLGWIVAHVDAVTQDSGKTLDQARAELTAPLAAQKAQAALAAIHDGIDDSLSGNANFNEVIADRKLAALTTPALTAGGIDRDTPDARPDPALAQIVAAGFQAAEGDAPQMVQTAADGSFALVGLGRIVPAAPRPLAQVRDMVAKAFVLDRARTAARALANRIVAEVNKGTPLAQALSGAGRSLPPAKPLAASRAQLAANPRAAPAPLVLMFSMTQGTARLIAAPDGNGWLIVKLDRIVPGNAAGQAGVLAATRRDLGRQIGNEYVQQFAKAVRADLGTTIDAAAVARGRAALLGAGGQAN